MIPMTKTILDAYHKELAAKYGSISKNVSWDYTNLTVLVIWSTEPPYAVINKEKERIEETSTFRGYRVEKWADYRDATGSRYHMTAHLLKD